MKTVREAIACRIQELLKQKNITKYRLAMDSGVPPTTISAIINRDFEDVKLSKIIQVAGGFDMSVSQFLDSPLFDEENLNL